HQPEVAPRIVRRHVALVAPEEAERGPWNTISMFRGEQLIQPTWRAPARKRHRAAALPAHRFLHHPDHRLRHFLAHPLHVLEDMHAGIAPTLPENSLHDLLRRPRDVRDDGVLWCLQRRQLATEQVRGGEVSGPMFQAGPDQLGRTREIYQPDGDTLTDDLAV